MIRGRRQEGRVESNYGEEEFNKGDDDMGRYIKRNKVGSLGCRFGGVDGGNNNKFRGDILRIPPLCAFVLLLFETITGSVLES